MAQNRCQPHHQTDATINFPFSSQKCDSRSMKGLRCKLLQRTGVAVARAEVTVTGTAIDMLELELMKGMIADLGVRK